MWFRCNGTDKVFRTVNRQPLKRRRPVGCGSLTFVFHIFVIPSDPLPERLPYIYNRKVTMTLWARKSIKASRTRDSTLTRPFTGMHEFRRGIWNTSIQRSFQFLNTSQPSSRLYGADAQYNKFVLLHNDVCKFHSTRYPDPYDWGCLAINPDMAYRLVCSLD